MHFFVYSSREKINFPDNTFKKHDNNMSINKPMRPFLNVNYRLKFHIASSILDTWWFELSVNITESLSYTLVIKTLAKRVSKFNTDTKRIEQPNCTL